MAFHTIFLHRYDYFPREKHMNVICAYNMGLLEFENVKAKYFSLRFRLMPV